MNPEIIKQFNMSIADYNEIVKRLQREPNIVELGLFSAMWSEHCSYRSSKEFLKRLPTHGKLVVTGPGENAGVISITDDLYLSFKVESHNHPSAVEPFQGAATGVGGIIRDIFTMGARPIASYDSLCFDLPDNPRARYLLNGVVEGIAYYGNCVGVPTLGGETRFDSCYEENPLINAMTIGILPKSSLRSSEAKHIGSNVIYIGAKTGRDGLHGASFASGVLDEEAQKKRGSVQVGDPFLEKLLIEATLQIIDEDLIEAIQDMGAAGLTSSSVEMAGKGNKGMKLNLDQVPLRETDLTPVEMMLSESQERMLLISKPGKEDRIKEILNHWELDYAIIGVITDTGLMEIDYHDSQVASVPIEELLNPPITSIPPVQNHSLTPPPLIIPGGIMKEKVKQFLQDPQFGSKRWIFEQYDHTLLTNTVNPPGIGASLLRIKDTDQYLGVTLISNGRNSAIDPYVGVQTTIAQCARRITALGLTPSAITNCLNFGDPNQPHTRWELSQTVEGMREILEAMEVPVVSGNVSLYNEGIHKRIYPTPTIGMVGLGSLSTILPVGFPQEGLIVAVVGKTNPSDCNSETLPALSIREEILHQDLIRFCIQTNLLTSCLSIDRGGIIRAIQQCVVYSSMGIECEFPVDTAQQWPYLRCESNGRYLISYPSTHEKAIQELFSDQVPLTVIGHTIPNDLKLDRATQFSVEKIVNWYQHSFKDYMEY
ncbi:phosphoribosylformylglycinamidine synthase subunit PurL [bacterium]|nr:phosphoribosylformylglycinamidine synthase subunit PurL [bacterium]